MDAIYPMHRVIAVIRVSIHAPVMDAIITARFDFSN